MRNKIFGVGMALLVILMTVFGSLTLMAPVEQAAAQYSVPCYMEQGGAKFVASSGCEIEIQSGATFDLQSGSTTDFSGGVDLDGADLVIDADGDSILDENTDDAIRLTLPVTSGTFGVLTGNLKVGNGSPSTAQDGEDAYVEGNFEADGTARLDGGVDANGIIDQDGAADAVQLAVTGYTTQTNDLAQFDGGLVDVGGGTYGTADGDNDLGVDGDIEANGNGDIGGNLIVDDVFNIDDTVTAISGSQTVTPSATVLTVAPTVASTITLATGSASAGDFLLILNTVATNTNIADTGATDGGGSIDLGQNDLALFIFLNSIWVEVTSPDNS